MLYLFISDFSRAICTYLGRIPGCASQVISTSSPGMDLYITNCLIIWTGVLSIIHRKTFIWILNKRKSRPSLFLELLVTWLGLSLLCQLCFTGIVPEAYAWNELPNVAGLFPVQYLVNYMVTMLHYFMFLADLVFIHSVPNKPTAIGNVGLP